MEFKIGDKVRVKGGVKDPDVPKFIIGGLCGIVDDIDYSNIGVKLDSDIKYPQWYIDELDNQGLVIESCTYLDEDDIEHVSFLTPQPQPKEQGKVVYESLKEMLENGGCSDKLKQLCNERYHQGLEKYGQPLMSDDGRDTTSDVIQEMIDGIMYLQKGITQGKGWSRTLVQLVVLTDDFLFDLENEK